MEKKLDYTSTSHRQRERRELRFFVIKDAVHLSTIQRTSFFVVSFSFVKLTLKQAKIIRLS